MLLKKRIVVGISGGIAVYKVCSLVNYLKKEGAEVRIIMTEAATKFVTPLTFQTLTKNPVYTEMFKVIDKKSVEHISLADWADMIIVVPATANTISKISLGIADNLLTTVLLAFPKNENVVLVPSMNTVMWDSPILQNNLKNIRKYNKYSIIEPESGLLACERKGKGKIPSNKDIIHFIKNIK